MRSERIKSFVLASLLILSILQVGILWNSNDYGSPFYFVTKRFNVAQAGQAGYEADSFSRDADAKQILLNPFRMTLCDGEDHYIIPRKSEEFKSVKELSFLLFEEVLNGRELRRDISIETWNTLVSRKSFLLEFKIPTSQDIIKWATGYFNTGSSAPEDVQKMLIIPRDGTGVGLYLLTSKGIVQFASKTASVSELEQLHADALIAIDIENINVIKYATINEFGASSYSGFRGDVMGNINGRKSTLFKSLMYTVPFFIRSAEFANTVLGNDINSYSRSYESAGSVMAFKNFTNLYRFHIDGLMEYSYIPTASTQDKGDIYSALSNALVFVLRIKNDLLDEPELYLSGISQDESSYRFTFDYIFGDFPVYFTRESKQMDEIVVLENAVVIQANGKRAISCKWALVDMYHGKEIKDIETAFDTINVINFPRISVDDISIAYRFDMNSKGQQETAKPVWPVWRIEAPDGSATFIPMGEGRGSGSGMG